MGACGTIHVTTPWHDRYSYRSGVQADARVEDGIIVDAPKVIQDWVGRDAREVWRWQSRRGVKLEWVPD